MKLFSELKCFSVKAATLWW